MRPLQKFDAATCRKQQVECKVTSFISEGQQVAFMSRMTSHTESEND